ncbi:MAG: hypothetical protein QW594_01235 [Candidatus Woesearchaeota archaeon]
MRKYQKTMKRVAIQMNKNNNKQDNPKPKNNVKEKRLVNCAFVFALLGLVVILGILLVLPVAYASAKITIVSTPAKAYSYGDFMQVSGIIQTQEILEAEMKLQVVCEEKKSEIVLSQHHVVLQAHEQKTFAELGIAPSVRLSKEMEGICIFSVVLYDKDMQKETQASTAPFVVKNSLEGSITLVQPEVELGKKLLLKGMVTTLQGRPVQGIATMYLKNKKQSNDDTLLLVGTAPISQGILNAEVEIKQLAPGSYEVLLSIEEKEGNNAVLLASHPLEVKAASNLQVTLNKEAYYTGETIIVNGYVNSYDYTITSTVFETKQVLVMKNPDFSLSVQIPKHAGAAKYPLRIRFSDKLGNAEEKELLITVLPTLSKLSAKARTPSIREDELLEIELFGFDQENNPYAWKNTNHRLTAILLDQNKTKKSTIKIAAKEQLHVATSGLSPGTYTLVLLEEQYGVSTQLPLKIEPKPNLRIGLDETMLVVKNEGPYPFKENITIILKNKSEEKTIQRYLDLLPGATQALGMNLNPKDAYEVSIMTKGFNKTYDQGSLKGITGFSLLQGNPGIFSWLTLAVLIIAIIVSFYIYSKKKQALEEEAIQKATSSTELFFGKKPFGKKRTQDDDEYIDLSTFKGHQLRQASQTKQPNKEAKKEPTQKKDEAI